MRLTAAVRPRRLPHRRSTSPPCESAFVRRPAAVLLTIDHPSGEIFTYNVDQKSPPWPVPVILVAPKDRPLLDRAQQSGQPVSVSVQGAWRRDAPGRNVVGRLDRGLQSRKRGTLACDLDAGDELVHQQLRARSRHCGLPR